MDRGQQKRRGQVCNYEILVASSSLFFCFFSSSFFFFFFFFFRGVGWWWWGLFSSSFSSSFFAVFAQFFPFSLFFMDFFFFFFFFNITYFWSSNHRLSYPNLYPAPGPMTAPPPPPRPPPAFHTHHLRALVHKEEGGREGEVHNWGGRLWDVSVDRFCSGCDIFSQPVFLLGSSCCK